MRIYLPLTFVQDARECDMDMWPLWEWIESHPLSRRGGGQGYWVELTPEECRLIRKEAAYRAEYWLTDAYGLGNIQPHERVAGHAAVRVRHTIDRDCLAGVA